MTAADARPRPQVAQVTEVHRLAVVGRQTSIARDTGDRLGAILLGWSRFAQVEAIATATLSLGPHAGAFYDRGWAYSSTGRPRPALADYQQALTLYRQAGDRGNEAATLSNIGGVYARLGDHRQALTFYEQALPIQREVGDRVGEAVTRYNMAMVYRADGDLVAAVAELERVVELDRQVEHPDLADDTALLEQVRRELT